jgi:hypothetical protein
VPTEVGKEKDLKAMVELSGFEKDEPLEKMKVSQRRLLLE